MNRIPEIHPPDARAAAAARQRWNSIAKPLGSFGILETMLEKIAAIQGTPDIAIDRRTVIVCCGDHGVVEEGVTQTDSHVTTLCAESIAAGNANVNAIAAQVGADVLCVDFGMREMAAHPAILQRRIAAGTKNFTRGAAMTTAQAEAAICAGMDIVHALKSRTQILVAGEMGIGNTTSAAALAAVLLGKSPEDVTGRGAGLTTEGLQRKIHAVKTAIAVNQPDAARPLDLLAKLGGFEIAGMTGICLGGAYAKIPVIIDGVISAAAAAIACRMQPCCAEYLLAGHVSEEPAGAGLLALMGLSAPIHAGLRLGEGTGGLLLIPLLESALALYRNAHRFSALSMQPYTALS